MSLQWFGDQVYLEILNKTAAVAEKIAEKWAIYGEEESPLDTGVLQSSCNYTSEPLLQEAYVHWDARYAYYVQMGFSPHGPRSPNDFFGRSAERAVADAATIINEVFN